MRRHAQAAGAAQRRSTTTRSEVRRVLLCALLVACSDPAEDGASTFDAAALGDARRADAGAGFSAVAGPDRDVPIGSTVVLDGALSAAPPAATYRWRLVSTPAQSAAAIAAPTAMRTSFVADREGAYVVELVVVDGGVSSAPSTATIRAVPPQPRAIVDAPARVHAGQVVMLDGSRSVGAGLRYRWIGTGPTPVVFTGGDQALASFVAAQAGHYQIRLQITDALDRSADWPVTIEATNAPPLAKVSDPLAALTGAPLVLDASGSSDADGDPLRARWRLAARPLSSAATVRATGDLTAELVPDRDGEYRIELWVSDGVTESYTVTWLVVAARARHDLDVPVVAAASAGDLVLLATLAPSAVRIMDPMTGTTDVVPLALPPHDVAVTPDGRTAVVGHSGWITLVDVAARRATATTPVRGVVAHLEVADDGWAYFKQTGYPSEELYALRLADGTLRLLEERFGLTDIAWASGTLYAWESNANDAGWYRVALGAVSEKRGHVGPCIPLFPRPDGQRVLAGCNQVLAGDLSPIGTLDGVDILDWTEQAAWGGSLLWAIARDTLGNDVELRVFDAATFALRNEIVLPYVPRPFSFIPARPRWVLPLSGDRAAVVFDDRDYGATRYGVVVVAP